MTDQNKEIPMIPVLFARQLEMKILFSYCHVYACSCAMKDREHSSCLTPSRQKGPWPGSGTRRVCSLVTVGRLFSHSQHPSNFTLNHSRALSGRDAAVVLSSKKCSMKDKEHSDSLTPFSAKRPMAWLWLKQGSLVGHGWTRLPSFEAPFVFAPSNFRLNFPPQSWSRSPLD